MSPHARLHAFGTVVALVLFGAFVAADRDRPEDVLVPQKGREVEGFLVRSDEKEVVFRVGSRDRVFAAEEVAEIRSPALLYRELAARLRQSPLGDVESGAELARWCAGVGLEREAQFAWWRVLAVDWGHEEAHEALGSRLKKNGWQVRVERKWLTREKFFERVTEWNSALDIATSFHEVRSSALFEDSLASIDGAIVAFDLVFREFGDLFDLSYPRQLMEVHLHGDGSFPAESRRMAYFDREENRVICDSTRWDGLASMAHEATHQLLWGAYLMVDDGRGEPPGWFDEGLAEIVAALVELSLADRELGPDGEPVDLVPPPTIEVLLDTERAKWHLRRHAGAEDPFELRRVLNFDADQFHAADGAYMAYAQAFSLVTFLLLADDGAYREGLQRFVAMTFEGKRSGTHFEKAMGIDLDELEERWIGYVRARVQDDQ